ncbi:MAG: putative glycosyltransferase [Bacteroidota bacterium]|jgi:GT2 family glycosyltransferase|nr:putative glycosyltransferase [Bacteroidota bacterium]
MLNDKVAVVILNWNGRVFLEKFLPSVIEHSSGAQIIVADNQSSDDSIIFLNEHYPQVRVIINPSNDGFSKGYNLALKQVQASYYVLLNSDVEVTENWIQPILELMRSDDSIGACQPKILDYNHKSLFEYAGASGGFIDKYGYPFCRGRIFNVLESDKGQYDFTTEVFWATGACMFVRAEAFWKVNGFDDDYFAHMEEIDLCWRMKNIGYRVFVEPKSTVYHVGGGTLNKLSPRKTFLNFRNNLITLTKNSNAPLLFLKVFYRMLLDGVAAIKFLLEGHGAHFFAVIKAHGSYYLLLNSTLKKRKAMKAMPGFRNSTKGVYRKNIVFSHFIKGKNYFTELSDFNES